MPVFQYRAFDRSGNDAAGILVADNPRSARDQLRAEGLVVSTLDQKSVGRSTSSWRLRAGGAQFRWTEAAYELATLLAGGVPLLKALDVVAQQSTGVFRRTLLEIRDRVAAGVGFAEALSEFPDVFDELSIRLVEVGENSGNLEQSLDRLAEFKMRWHQLRDRVIGAMVYPVFVLTFGVAATLFLMTFVMPPLLENLQETLTSLPWPTRVVQFGSEVLLNHGLIAVLVGVILAIAGGAALRSAKMRYLLDWALLRLPIFGALRTKQSLSRMALILSTLLESGLPLANALDLASRSMGNRVLNEALRSCRESLLAGGGLAESLSQSNVIPPLAVQVFSVGQESGRLEELLTRLANDYDRQVQSTTDRLASVLEPVLILVLAAMIGFVLLAIILPILEAGNVAM
ncbi:MAG: type II secretion system F family protein [Planctomycetota bacterium]